MEPYSTHSLNNPDRDRRLRRLERECWLWRAVFTLSLLWWASSALADVPTLTVRRLQTEREAVSQALQYALNHPAPGALRFLWIQAPVDESAITDDDRKAVQRRIAAGQLVINCVVSKAFHPYKAAVLFGGRLLAINLVQAIPPKDELLRVSQVWENFADIDPFFLEQQQRVEIEVVKVSAADLAVGDMILFSADTPIKSGTQTVGTAAVGEKLEVLQVSGDWLQVRKGGRLGYVWRNSRGVVGERKTSGKTETIEAAPNAAHVDDLLLQLQELCGTRIPIMRLEFFVSRALTSLNLVDGQYYKFLDIEGKNLREVVKQWGGDIDAVRAAKVRNRIGIFRSKITGNPRAVELIPTTGVAPGVGTGLGVFTEDLQAGKIDPAKHPLENLFEIDSDGGEAIFQLPNGFPAFFVFDGDENLADVVAQAVTTDGLSKVHQRFLVPGLSCIRCHTDGVYIDSSNDVAWLIRNGGGIGDIVGDLSQDGKSLDEIRSEILSLYGGSNFNDVFDDARVKMSVQVYRATGMAANEAWAALVDEYESYEAGAYTPRRALRLLGWEIVGDAEPIQIRSLFRQICPPVDGVRTSWAVKSLRVWGEDATETPPELSVRDYERIHTTIAYLAEAARPGVLAAAGVKEE